MSLLTIAGKSIRQRALASSLTALGVALGVTLMVSVLVINGIVEKMFNQTASGYDLIIGPKGSPLQLVLNTVYRVSQPIENLPYCYYQQLLNDPRIQEAVPFALGDVTEEGGFPIVGTTSRYFELQYIPGRNFRMTADSSRLTHPFDAIIGHRVARVNGWKVGSQFALVHGGADTGHVHEEKFTVVGVLAPTGTPNDKTVFVNLEGFYLIEGHDKPVREAVLRAAEFCEPGASPAELEQRIARLERQIAEEERAHSNGGEGQAHHHRHAIPDVQKEVTAVLVNVKGQPPANAFTMIQFQAELKEGLQAQAINPVQQIRWLMDNIIGNVRTLLMVLTALIIAVSGVGIFVSIYNSMAERRREIAIMRALGARRRTVFAIILTESILLCAAGGGLGLALGHTLVFAAAPVVEARAGIVLEPFAFEPLELVLFPALLVLASLVGFIPALTAYRTDVARALAE